MILFQKKVDKVINVADIEKRHKEKSEHVPLEKGDLLAMLIAAFLVFFPVVLLIIGVTYGIMWLFIR